jgi:hypothetical protein
VYILHCTICWLCTGYFREDFTETFSQTLFANAQISFWTSLDWKKTLPPDIQTGLESKPFDQLLKFWCLFYQRRDFGLSSKTRGPGWLFYLQNCQVWPWQKWQSDFLLQNGHIISGTVGRIDAWIWTHFQTRKSYSFRDMGILRHVTCWEIVPNRSFYCEDAFSRGPSFSHTSYMALKRMSDWSAVNPLQNECICHSFDGNLGELGAFLQSYGKFRRQKVGFSK